MAFTIVSDWWSFLDRRTHGRLAQVFVLGETADVHPGVDEAAEFATSAIYNALLTKYPTAAVDAFGPADADAEMRLHAGALAMFALSSSGGSERGVEIATDYAEAQTWLTKVRSGTLPIPALVAAAAIPNTTPKGFVRWRARERNFTRGKRDSGTVTEYDIRNPRL